MKTIKGAVTAPKGFKAAGVRCGLKQSGNDFAMIVSDATASAAFADAPAGTTASTHTTFIAAASATAKAAGKSAEQ